MSLYCRVIQAQDLDEILDFEKRKLHESSLGENEKQFEAWNARWRKESLDHYVGMGWSFLIRDPSVESPFSKEGLLLGYFIAQPLLFFDGYTQSLWVEHLQHSTIMARDELCEIAYKLCREKHFQKIFFPQSNQILNSVKQFRSEPWNPQVLHIKTSKM